MYMAGSNVHYAASTAPTGMARNGRGILNYKLYMSAVGANKS